MSKQEKKKGPGRPLIPIDWKTVASLLEADCKGTEVAAYLGLKPEELYRRCLRDNKVNFQEYSRQKKEKGDSLLRAKQYESAVKDKDRTMLIWMGKQRLGQKEKHEHDVNQPIIVTIDESEKDA